MTPSLLELQQSLRRSMVEGEDAEAGRHVVSAGLAPRQRLAVYRNTFGQTLVRALRLSFPAVERLVGADFFEAAARDFIAGAPPRSSWLDEFGAEFPGFLERFAPAAALPYLAEVARLEWAVSRALHAPDADPLDPAALAAVGADAQARIRFTPQPSLGLVACSFPADAIWRAVLDEDDAALAALDLASGPAWLLVQRGPAGVEVLRLDEPRWRLVQVLCAGRPLGLALAEHAGDHAAATLAELLSRGRLAGFELAPPCDPNSDFRSPT
ncbi:putative DNA-binding domain-containing protein [Ramlibacter sp. 2FC]|uniref:HvfC/BufC family peptide modification chaperone n=1 Tax=Ramlibacter sp. 2FC TaxID=2502188 RepID=UPI0010F53ADC|nr:putative DNA-binding domain-containing protein [Ramlibacter sp. 2FC]